jgi:hypothetical protein
MESVLPIGRPAEVGSTQEVPAASMRVWCGKCLGTHTVTLDGIRISALQRSSGSDVWLVCEWGLVVIPI